MLRLASPFVCASLGGIIALLGDKLWLAYDTLLKPINQVLPHGLVYAVIGIAFLAGLAMMGWSVVLYRRNGFALHEIRDEIAHRRREQERQRFATFARRSRLPGERGSAV